MVSGAQSKIQVVKQHRFEKQGGNDEHEFDQAENEQNLYRSIQEDEKAENISFATQGSKTDKL